MSQASVEVGGRHERSAWFVEALIVCPSYSCPAQPRTIARQVHKEANRTTHSSEYLPGLESWEVLRIFLHYRSNIPNVCTVADQITLWLELHAVQTKYNSDICFVL